MGGYNNYLNSLVNKNRENFSAFPQVAFINYYQAKDYQQKRDDLIKNLSEHIQWQFKHTKPFLNKLSQGCQFCGQGKWSCLFITGICNAACFYCPSPQNSNDLPTTQQLTFPSPEAYTEYVNRLNYKGVSFSGGEPLLAYEKVMQYLTHLRKHGPPDLYIWMYTNGILATHEKLAQLADAGLDEIRFDIGATGFSLDKVKIAKGLIPNITIEIPAVPEEKEKLIALLPKMVDAGVTCLNLHQMRLTKHNAKKLTERRYTYSNAEQPVVIESELTALEIMNHAAVATPNLRVNYCAFYFKNRYQQAGYRNQVAQFLKKSHLEVTEKGYYRYLFVVEKLSDTNKLSNQQLMNPDFRQLLGITKASIDMLMENNFQDKSIILTYAVSKLSEHPSPQVGNHWFNNCNHILPDTRFKTSPIIFETTEIEKLKELLATKGQAIPDDDKLFEIWQHEFIEWGFRGYF